MGTRGSAADSNSAVAAPYSVSAVPNSVETKPGGDGITKLIMIVSRVPTELSSVSSSSPQTAPLQIDRPDECCAHYYCCVTEPFTYSSVVIIYIMRRYITIGADWRKISARKKVKFTEIKTYYLCLYIQTLR